MNKKEKQKFIDTNTTMVVTRRKECGKLVKIKGAQCEVTEEDLSLGGNT